MTRTLEDGAVDDTNLIEPVAIMPTFGHGFTAHAIGANVHLTFYVEQPVPGMHDGRRERLINARVIIPIEAISAAWPWVVRSVQAHAIGNLKKPDDMLLS